MKTILLNLSPKKSFSASQYFLDVQRLFLSSPVVTEKLRTPGDSRRILPLLEDGDTVLFSLPLYVDGVPSHALSFLREMEQFCRGRNIHLRVYVLCNNGFIEGSQSKALMAVFQNFCIRSGFTWGGGIGTGGGVMLNIMRIVLLVYVGVLLLNIFLSGLRHGNWLPLGALRDFASQLGGTVFLNLGVLFYTAGMGRAVRKQSYFGEKYTRILLPSFLFILAADFFFLVTSILKGGLFRGWLAKKPPLPSGPSAKV